MSAPPSGSILNGTVGGSSSNRLRTDGGGWYGSLDNVTLANDLTVVPGFKLSVLNGLMLANDARVTINNNGSEFYQHSGLYMNYGTQTLGGTGEIAAATASPASWGAAVRPSAARSSATRPSARRG